MKYFYFLKIISRFVGSSDICWDYSFWHGEDRCLKVGDKENDFESEGYGRRNPDALFKSHPILCNYTQFDCTYSSAQNIVNQNKYCPNCYGDVRKSISFNSCPCQPGKGSFLCTQSNTCIPDGISLFWFQNSAQTLIEFCFSEKKCDGVVHCIYGEDESFENCKDSYPEEATITCIEDRPIGYDIWIKAVPCNGIKECRSREDEECEISDNILLGTMAAIFLVLLLVSILMRYFIWRYRSKSNAYPKAQCDFEIRKGNDLVNLKVCKYNFYLTTFNHIIYFHWFHLFSEWVWSTELFQSPKRWRKYGSCKQIHQRVNKIPFNL